jgi:2-(1,2-epoxy-1,2-dihydrophenyl)acetyl-CoA isomerase
MEFERATLDIEGSIGILKLNHPEVMNAVSPEMVGGLMKALDEIDRRHDEVRCVIMTGEGRGFCAGANLQPSSGARGDAGMLLETVFHPFLRRLRELAVPLITAVNGAAAGVGMSFALMGDLVLCARSAYFLQAFRRIGLVPDGGSTWILPRLIGRARASELSLLGKN